MSSMKKVLLCCGHNLRRWTSEPRILLLMLLIPGYLSLLERPVVQLCGRVGVPASPWIFPFLTNDWYTLMVLMLGVILLFCDAPFIDDTQPYLLLRTGRAEWMAGQILYIIVGSALYFGYTLLVSVLLLLPELTLQGDWGKVYYTLSGTDAGRQFQIPLNFSSGIITGYTPASAMLISFLTALLAGALLGLVIMVINLYTRRAVGITAAALLVLLQAFSINLNEPILRFFSPISWAGLDTLSGGTLVMRPTLTYCLSTLLALICICGLLAVRAAERRNIDVDPLA